MMNAHANTHTSANLLLEGQAIFSLLDFWNHKDFIRTI
jgi:hypothetical protein